MYNMMYIFCLIIIDTMYIFVPTIFIRVFIDGGFCDYDVTSGRFQYSWPETAAGQEASVSCQGGVMGVARRMCNSTGEWEEPNLIDCCKKVNSCLLLLLSSKYFYAYLIMYS